MFGRKKNTTLIPELEQYYKTESKSVFRNWFISIASLVATFAIIIGGFFGVQALYNSIKDDDQKIENITEVKLPEDNKTNDTAKTESEDQSTNPTDQDNTSSATTTQPNTVAGTSTDTPNTLTNTGPNDSPAPAESTQQSTTLPLTLPNTGPQ